MVGRAGSLLPSQSVASTTPYRDGVYLNGRGDGDPTRLGRWHLGAQPASLRAFCLAAEIQRGAGTNPGYLISWGENSTAVRGNVSITATSFVVTVRETQFGTARVETYDLVVGQRSTWAVRAVAGVGIEVYKNGALQVPVSSTGTVPTAAIYVSPGQPFWAGSNLDYSALGALFGLALWDRDLGSSVVRDMSMDIHSALHIPRRIYIPGAAAGGGGGTTITCSVAAASADGVSASIVAATTITCSVAASSAAGVTVLLNTSVNASPAEAAAVGVGASIALAGSTVISTSPAAATATGVSSHVDLTLNATPAAAGATGVSALLPRAIGTAPADASADGLAAQLQRIFGVQVADAIAAGVQALVNNASATVARPTGDTSNSGWSASTGSDLYAMLDEVTPDAADYIVATSAGAVCELALNATGYPGTSSQVLKFRASSSTGNSIIVRLKNTGGATVRSATQLLTSTDTEYSITLTAPEIAAITSGDLSVQLESA